nr:collagen alpha-1(XIX) chain-like [Nerophis lumbriciformis]
MSGRATAPTTIRLPGPPPWPIRLRAGKDPQLEGATPRRPTSTQPAIHTGASGECPGFDLTEKFLLRKGTVTEDLPSFRLGSSPLIKPTKHVFPDGLPSEYSLVTIFRVRRTTKRDRWYLWQIFDQAGDTQVSVVVDGSKKAVEFSSQSLTKNVLRYTFKSRDLHALFDRQWHKLSFSVQSNIVSVYMDCKLIERRLTAERDGIDPSGRTLITTRIQDGRPVDVELKQMILYCDPYMVDMETCCELLEPQCEAKKTFNDTLPPPVTSQLPQMLSQPLSQPVDRCHCPAEKTHKLPEHTEDLCEQHQIRAVWPHNSITPVQNFGS